MDINSAINSAGGIGAIAQQLGIDEDTAERGIGALLPRVQSGVENNGVPADAVDPQVAVGGGDSAGGGLGGLLGGGGGAGGLGGMLGGGAGGGLLGGLIGGGIGNQILGHIFGSKDVSREVAADASQKSGVDPSVLKKLLPIVAGMVAMHYITKGRQGAAPGGTDAGDQGGGGLGGMLGSILGGNR